MNFIHSHFSMAAVDSSDPVMPEWAKPRDKNAPQPVQLYLHLHV